MNESIKRTMLAFFIFFIGIVLTGFIRKYCLGDYFSDNQSVVLIFLLLLSNFNYDVKSKRVKDFKLFILKQLLELCIIAILLIFFIYFIVYTKVFDISYIELYFLSLTALIITKTVKILKSAGFFYRCDYFIITSIFLSFFLI